MNKRFFALPVAVLIVLFILAAPVVAGTIRTEYEGLDIPVAPLPGGRQWVSEDGILHIRGVRELYRDEVDDSRLCGDAVVTANMNFHFAAPPVFVYGPMWGTMRIDNDNGYWEGNWVGQRTESQGFSYIRATLHGHGDYEGLQARVSYVRETPNPAAPFVVHGVVMDPGGD